MLHKIIPTDSQIKIKNNIFQISTLDERDLEMGSKYSNIIKNIFQVTYKLSQMNSVILTNTTEKTLSQVEFHYPKQAKKCLQLQ